MKLDHPELQSRLAAEYVLGTMRGGARRRFEEYLRDSQTLRIAVSQWETRLMPMADQVPPVTPPDRVWKKIVGRVSGSKTQALAGIGKQNAANSRTSWRLFDSLLFWRNLGLSASTLVIVLTVGLFAGNGWQARDPMMTAVLEDDGVARMIVEQPRADLLMIKMVKPWKTASTKSLQLWVMPKDGPPRSIGIINQDGSTKIRMQDLPSMLDNGLSFAVSKEPPGGSPTGQPTGMILCKGVIATMPPKRGPVPLI